LALCAHFKEKESFLSTRTLLLKLKLTPRRIYSTQVELLVDFFWGILVVLDC
jgi:hypothetical protein